MDALELLKAWPAWSRAGTETILASPAWRMPVQVGVARGVMAVGQVPDDPLCLDITFDGEPFVLALDDSALYPDLHLLWSRRRDLPCEIVLALVEKECGDVLTMLENVVRRQLGVKGLSQSAPAGRAYAVSVPSGSFGFMLDFPPTTLQTFARLENLDPVHPLIRGLTRSARVDYTMLMLTEDERATMKAGDFLLLPENFPATQAWIVESPSEGALHLLSAGETPIAFGAFADDKLPPIPPPSALVLAEGDRTLFSCELTVLGDAKAIRILPADR